MAPTGFRRKQIYLVSVRIKFVVQVQPREYRDLPLVVFHAPSPFGLRVNKIQPEVNPRTPLIKPAWTANIIRNVSNYGMHADCFFRLTTK